MSPKESEKISTVYIAERKKLLGYIRKKMSGSLEAEDILQDVFYQLTLGFRDLDRIQNLTGVAPGSHRDNRKKDWRRKYHEKYESQPCGSKEEMQATTT